MSQARALRDRLAQPRILTVPGAADALTARIVEDLAFDAVYVTGAGYSNASLGTADVGLVTMTEMAEQVARLHDVVNLPLIVDADTGYGGVLNVRRMVRTFERCGAAAIQMEDQAEPKRCGHFEGKRLIPRQDMIQKLSAALDSRNDDDVLIIARTDALQVEGLDAAIERANAYTAAGADLIFVEAPEDRAQLEQLPREIKGPLIANMVEGGKTPLLTCDELEAIGYSAALFANSALRAAILGVQTLLTALKHDGGTHRVLKQLADWDERQRLVGLPDLQALENGYLSATTATP